MIKNIKLGLFLALFCGILIVIFIYKKSMTSQNTHNTDPHVELLFKDSITRIIPSKGDVLEVATLESFETITRRDTKTLFDNLINLGTTVSEIKVKVTYRYHILLSDEWVLEHKNNILYITPPPIRPSPPPAIHTDQMEKNSASGWLRFNEEENMKQLEASLTPTLIKVAESDEKIKLVTNASHEAITNFVKTWILTQDHWQQLSIEHIVINNLASLNTADPK